jgi:hypothetical protein
MPRNRYVYRTARYQVPIRWSYIIDMARRIQEQNSAVRQAALRSTPLLHQPAGMSLGEFIFLPRMLHRRATPFRAWKFLRGPGFFSPL